MLHLSKIQLQSLLRQPILLNTVTDRQRQNITQDHAPVSKLVEAKHEPWCLNFNFNLDDQHNDDKEKKTYEVTAVWRSSAACAVSGALPLSLPVDTAPGSPVTSHVTQNDTQVFRDNADYDAPSVEHQRGR